MINQVFNEDCFEGTKRLSDKRIDMLLTDIPFGMEFQSNYRKEKHIKIANDDNIDWFPNWIKEIDRVCKDDAHLYIFCSHHNIDVFKR